MRRFLLAGVVALIVSSTAGATTGGLTQLPAPHDCIVEGATTEGCTITSAIGVTGPSSVAISPDGRNVYIAGLDSNSVAEFARGGSGVLTQLAGVDACVGWTGASSECTTTTAGMQSPSAVTVSPDGKNVYVLGRQSNAIVEFARDQTTGALTSLGCVQGLTGTECATSAPGIFHPEQLVVSSDGANAYATSSGGPGFVAEFARNANGTLRQLSAPNDCIEGTNDPNTPQCGTTDAPGLLDATAITEATGSSDDVYVGGNATRGTIAEFTRNSDGSLTQLSGADACIAQSGNPACGANVATGLRFVDGIVASPDGQNVYTASDDDRGSVAEFARNAGGQLVQLASPDNCVFWSSLSSGDPRDCGTSVTGLSGDLGLAISPEGSNLYVAAANSGALVELTRNANGTLTQPAAPNDCIAQNNPSCGAAGHGLTEPTAVVVSPDGANVYASTYPGGFTGIVVEFARTSAPVIPTHLTVNAQADGADANPGDGVCADASGDCTLRAAIQESNADCNGMAITVPAGTYGLTRGDLFVSCATTITGAGARSTTIERAGGASAFRIIEIASGTVAISDVTLTNGRADGSDVGDLNPGVGGGIWVDSPGRLTLVDSTVSGNHASISGGGIDNDGALDVVRSTISGNSASGGSLEIGGGIDHFGSELTVTNSTISGNTAAVRGGGINAGGNGRFVNDTIASNAGGGFFREGVGNSQDFANTIIAHNSGGDCNSTPATSDDHDLSSDGTCGFALTGDAGLGTLANNGGPTDTQTPSEPVAIDAGDDAVCPATDQRGNARPAGSHCDIGAVEATLAAAPPPSVSATLSTVSASPARVAADGVTTSRITVTVEDSTGTPVAGNVVTLAADHGSSSISRASGPSDSSGVVTFTVTDAVAETISYTATDTTDSIAVTQTASVTFSPSVSAIRSTVTASPATVPADGVAQATITVSLKDGSGNAVAGKSMVLATLGGHTTIGAPSGPSDANGVVTFHVSDDVAESVTYTASDSTDSIPITGTAVVAFTALTQTVSTALSTVVASTANAPVGSFLSDAIVVTLKDDAGNPVPGKAVTLSSPGGFFLGGFPGSSQAVTDAQGKAVFSVGDAFAETDVYSATDTTDGVTLAQSAAVTYQRPAPPPSVSGANSTLQEVLTTRYSATITVTLRDAAGAPAAGKVVEATPEGTLAGIVGGPGTNGPATTDSHGVAFLSVFVNPVNGGFSLGFDIRDDTDGIAIGSIDVPFGLAPPAPFDPARSTFTATPSQLDANGVGEAHLVVRIRDSAGQPVTDIGVRLVDTGHATVDPSAATTDATGAVTFSLRDAWPETIRPTASVSQYEYSLAPSTRAALAADTIVFRSVLPADGHRSQISLSATRTGLSLPGTTLTVTLLNRLGGAAPGKTVTVTGVSGSAEATPVTRTTDHDGVAKFTLSDNKPERVRFLVRDTSDQVSLVTPTVTFVAHTIDTALSSVTAERPTSVADGQTTVALTVTLLDGLGKPIAGDLVILRTNHGNAVIAHSGLLRTDQHGQATFTVTDLAFQSVTFNAKAIQGTTAISIVGTTTVTFKPPGPDSTLSTFVAVAVLPLSDGWNATHFVLTVLDAAGRPVQGLPVVMNDCAGLSLCLPSRYETYDPATGTFPFAGPNRITDAAGRADWWFEEQPATDLGGNVHYGGFNISADVGPGNGEGGGDGPTIKTIFFITVPPQRTP